MSEERFKEIKDSIEAQLRIAKAYNYGEDLLEILNEEKDLYDYANELQQELERYKNIIDKAREYLYSLANSECFRLTREEEAYDKLTKKQIANNEITLTMIKSDVLLGILKGE